MDTVAAAAGVSRATVSNAFNRPDQLSAELRERVLAVARRVGYSGPDPVARSLATRRAGQVAFMLPTGLSRAFSDPALSVVLDAFTTTLEGQDHALVLLPGVEGGPRAERLAQISAGVAVAYGLPDGVPALEAVRRRRLPLVVIDSPVVRGSARVEIDDVGGAALAAQHVLDLGHRDIGLLSFQLAADGVEGAITESRRSSARYRTTRARLDGYLETLTAAGVDPAGIPMWECPANRQELARVGAAWLLDQRPRPTALLCTSDELALGALQAARDRAVRVPVDLSVVGFDDTPSSRWGDPPLTTVQQPLEDKGRVAGEFALALLAGRSPGRTRRLPTRLVLRGSTARRDGSPSG